MDILGADGTTSALRRRILVAAIVVVVAGALVAGVFVLDGPEKPDTGLSDPPERSAFVVDVPAEGPARVASVTAYNLSEADERAAFRALAENESARADRRAEFDSRMKRVAARAEKSANRDFTVRHPMVETHRRNGTGLVVTSATVVGLLDRTEYNVFIQEPFTSRFDPDTPLVVRVPEGYTVRHSIPHFDSLVGNDVTWRAETGLTGYRLVLGSSRPMAAPQPELTRDRGLRTDPISVFGVRLGPLAIIGIGLFVELLLYGVYRRIS